jgi:dihydrofolate synthase/folylpolyglutamate synthase
VAKKYDPAVLVEYERIVTELNERTGENRISPSLNRIESLLEYLGNPHLAYKVIHIAGTNGKTTTSRMIESLLRTAGLNTGLTISPHLQDLRERIQVNGAPIDIVDFVETYQELKPIVDLVEENLGQKISFFEFMTAMAFTSFAISAVDVAVIEVGMGGTWDATNLVLPSVCVITPIDLDHQQFLGDTIAEIAGEKAGIIKPDTVVVSARQHPDADRVLRNKANEFGVDITFRDEEFGVKSRMSAVGGQVLALQGHYSLYENLLLPLFGEHQAENASLALAAIEKFFGVNQDRPQISSDLVFEGFGGVTSPGRLEIIQRNPTVLIDVAHNPHGAAALRKALHSEFDFQYLVMIVAMFKDKDIEGFFESLQGVVDHIIITTIGHERSATIEDLNEAVSRHFSDTPTETVETLSEAYARAVELVDEFEFSEYMGTGILITGSVYTVGAARTLLKRVSGT